MTTVFNMKSITATNLINVFNGTCNFGTLLGAFLSDTYFGRYKTLGFASVSSFLVILYLVLRIFHTARQICCYIVSTFVSLVNQIHMLTNKTALPLLHAKHLTHIHRPAALLAGLNIPTFLTFSLIVCIY